MFIEHEEKRRLTELGIIRKGHFVLASGQHSEQYIDKNTILIRPSLLSWYCHEVASRVSKHRPDFIIGPVLGGALIAHRVAEHLTGIRDDGGPLALFADKQQDGSYELRRGFGEYVRGKTVAVVEDVITTGSAVRKVIDAVKTAGGRVACVTSLCNRGGVMGLDDVENFSVLMEFTVDAFPADACPLCSTNIPISKEFGRGPQLA